MKYVAYDEMGPSTQTSANATDWLNDRNIRQSR